ncbi:MAG: hypothetical protein PHP97_00795 [Candidatus Shapirobacteria bacterium]|nr:hypothetical protein [Candidatus Shapirobacteria bacterium]MDD3002750.1 hypothetical protein [Candidatus Shapirobacteria bacterium]MDD4383476.1 hypothetical protein [Candidatus Shapirobacteria bacterium]
MTIENKETITRCFCLQHSCEVTYDKLDQPIEVDGITIKYTISTTERFRFIKENNTIVDGGLVDCDIPTCRASKKYDFYDTIGDLKKAQNEEKNKNYKKNIKKRHR